MPATDGLRRAQPVYTRVEGWRLRLDMEVLVLVCSLVLVLAPAPSSLALHIGVNHAQHHHPVDMGQWSIRAPGECCVSCLSVGNDRHILVARLEAAPGCALTRLVASLFAIRRLLAPAPRPGERQQSAFGASR